jgi:hypothetical protein
MIQLTIEKWRMISVTEYAKIQTDNRQGIEDYTKE